MILPLGFGNLPRVFPWSIVVISVVTFIYSVAYFPYQKRENAAFRESANGCGTEIRNLKREWCSLPGNDPRFCEKNQKFTVGEKKSAREFHRRFRRAEFRKDRGLKSLNGYSALMACDESFEKTYRERNRREMIAGPGAIHPLAFIHSTIIHSGFRHLIGNLIFIIFFGIWIEQRVGGQKTGLIYFVGSAGGSLLHVLFTNTSVIGASGGLFSLMGAFFVFFHRSHFRFLFALLPFYMPIVAVPVVWFFPAFFLLPQVSGLVSSSGNTAYLGHVGAFVTGALIAYEQYRRENLPAGQLYLQEAEIQAELQKESDPVVSWKLFADLMEWNCQNARAILLFLEKKPSLNPQQEEFLAEKLGVLLPQIFRYNGKEEFLRLIRLLPDTRRVHRVFRKLPLRNILLLADEEGIKGHLDTAGFLYRSALLRKTGPRLRGRIQKALTHIEELRSHEEAA